MIKRKISQIEIKNRLKKLEEQTSQITSISMLFVDVEEDGRISIFEHDGAPKTYYESMIEAEKALAGMRDVTEKTEFFIDDMSVLECDLYLPAEPILYFCNSEERKRFIGLHDNNEWLTLYIALVQQIKQRVPDCCELPLPGFEDPALKDLSKNCNSMTVEQLTERYKDNRWFRGNK